jgi:hypothetical protein
MDCAGFEFSIEDVWRETLAFKTGERENRGGIRVINMSVSVLSGNFRIKPVLSQNWGGVLIPNFGETGNYQVGLHHRRRDNQMSGSTK